jgi:hypothetical protein
MMVLFLVLAASFAFYFSQQSTGFGSQLLRRYAQDAASLMDSQGYLSSPLDFPNNSNSSGIRAVMQALPSSVCMQVAAYGTAVPDGLVGYWKLDEDFGNTTADSSGAGNAGTLYNGAAFVEAGKSKRAAQFWGTSSSYIDAGNSSSLAFSSSQPFSISAWVFLPSVPSSLTGIVTKSRNSPPWYGIWVSAAGIWRAGGTTSDIDGGTATAGWHHVAIVQNSSAVTRKIYVDTAQTASGSAQDANGTGRLWFGGAEGKSEYFTGMVDEVRIYDRALSQSEITQLYSNPSNLAYVVDRQGCAYSGGEIQVISVPFVHNQNQNQNNYYSATIKVWLRGARS